MLTLINANRMQPTIAPVGLDYVGGAARRAGLDVELLDLGLADDPAALVRQYLARRSPELIGVSFRNVDDCFWPGAAWFVPELIALVETLRGLCGAPIVLGGVGFSVFGREILERSGADFGIRGDGEGALIALAKELRGARDFARVPGLLWRPNGSIRENPPAWPPGWSAPTARDLVDNAAYFRRGGQIGVETRRGCPRKCLYCADPLAKGPATRARDPAEVADEIEALLAQGVDVLHLCDSEFNVPADLARAVCDAMIGRRLGERVRWYAYLAVVPFDGDLASRMRRAGCVGINFTGDSASAAMLKTYRQTHAADDLAEAVRLCRCEGIAVMIDLLLGGPGETPQTLRETIEYVRKIGPDCAGAALGVRLYPGTEMMRMVAAEGPLEANPAIHRRYDGPVDLLQPTFYVSPALGEQPAQLVRDLIAGDPRFFEPADEAPAQEGDAAQGDKSNFGAGRLPSAETPAPEIGLIPVGSSDAEKGDESNFGAGRLPSAETPAPEIGLIPVGPSDAEKGDKSNFGAGRLPSAETPAPEIGLIPVPPVSAPKTGYNYNANQALVNAIAAGARGAYWDILRRLRSGELQLA